ncbi:MAG: peroxiredoxin family protein [Nannocystaceae bacterium]|nr:peroxiredoxin family protein [Nannocystaceae bacterium]
MQLQDHAESFAAKNASVVAIVVDAPAKNKSLSTKLGVKFPILSDPKLAAIRGYGIEHVGEDIALPATFVIAKDGRVLLVYVGDSPSDRPTVEALLAAL